MKEFEFLNYQQMTNEGIVSSLTILNGKFVLTKKDIDVSDFDLAEGERYDSYVAENIYSPEKDTFVVCKRGGKWCILFANNVADSFTARHYKTELMRIIARASRKARKALRQFKANH